MSFFRNLFESKPAQTDQEYTISLVDQLLEDKANPILISNLKEFSSIYSDEISSRGIPPLVKAFTKFSDNEDVIKDLIKIFADLLRSENNSKEENAKIFLQCDDTIPDFVRSLDNKNPQVRVGSMHVLMMIANLQPTLFTEALTSHQPQMIRLFGSISDKNEQISSRFVNTIPRIVESSPDFQQIVGFYAFEALVNSINRERPEFLEALMSVLKDNQINQSLFVNSGYLSIIENMIKTPDEKILNLMLLLFDPYKNANYLDSFRKNLESTNIINVLCDNIIRNVFRPLNVHLLAICIKGNQNLADRTLEKISNFVRLALETRKSATVNNGNNSFLDGVDLFGEFFESFVFESEDNAHFLNSTIINGQNIGVDSLTDNFLNLCTFSVLIAPNCKSDFENVFISLISNIRRYETVSSMFKFFVCFCWQSKEYCDMISEEERLTILIQFLIDDKNGNNGYFVPNSNLNSNEKKNHFLLLLFAEIILFSGKNKAKIGSVVNTTIMPYELENQINQFETSEYTDNSKFSQLEKQIIDYINDHHLSEAMKQFKNDNENNDNDDDFYQSEYNRLQKENKELKNKLIENQDDLDRFKSENDEKSRQIESLLSKIDEFKKQNQIIQPDEIGVNVTNKEIQLNNELIEEEEEVDDINDSQNNYMNDLKSIKKINNQLTLENQSIKELNEKMNQNLEEMQKQNSDLLEKVASLQSENNQQDDSQLSAEINNLTNQLKEKEEKVDDLMSQISELKSQLEDKNAILQNEEGKIHDLTLQLAESNNSNESLQEQNRITSNELDQLRSSLEDTKNISEDFQKQINEKNNSISSLQTQNEQLRNKIEKKSLETTQLIEKYNKEISDLRSQQNLNGGELISSLNNQIEELKNESSNQKIEFENEKEILRQNISKLQSENNKLEDNCNSLLDVKAKLQEEGKKHENDELLLTSKNDELQRKLNEIEDLNAQKVEAMKLTFETEKEKLRLENESLKNQLDKFNQSEDFNTNEVESLRKQINEMKSTCVPITEVEPIRKENVELTKKCSELNTRINELESILNKNPDVEKLDEENNVVELLHIKVSELENQLQKSKDECTEKDAIIADLHAQAKEAKKNQKMNDKLAADLQKANKDLLDQVIQMQEQIEELSLLTKQNHLFNLNSPINIKKVKQEQQQISSTVTKRDIQLDIKNDQNIDTQSKQQENDTHKFIIKSFEEQIEQLNAKINSLQNENQCLQAQLDRSTKDKGSNNNQKEEESNESHKLIIKSFEEQIEQLNNKINDLQNENQNIQIQLAQSSKIKSSIYNLEEEEEDSNELKQQIDQLNNTINDLQLENKSLHQQLELNKSENEKSENNEVKQQIEQLNQKINNLQNENNKLQKQSRNVTKLQKEGESNALLIKSLKEQNDELNSKVNDLQNENQLYQLQLNQPDDQSSELVVKELNQKVEQLNSKINILNDENNKLQNQLKQQNSDSFSSTKSNYELIIAKQRKLIDDLRAQNEKLEARTVQATSNVEELTSQNEKLRRRSTQDSAARIQELKKKLSQITKENTELRLKLEELQQTASKPKDEKRITFKNRQVTPTKAKTSNNNNVDDLIDEIENESNDAVSLNIKIKQLQNQNSLLMAENQQLKNAPSKALVQALQDEKADLEAKIYLLQDELNDAKKKNKKRKADDLLDDVDDVDVFLNHLPISPVHSKSGKKYSKSSGPSSADRAKSGRSKHSHRDYIEDDRNKLLTEIEYLKRDNENQSQAITDLQLMLGTTSFGSDGQPYVPAVTAFPYSSADDELKNLSVENDLLSSKLKEMQEIEKENRRLHNENMELKKLIRNRNGGSFTSSNLETTARESTNLADENKQKKALRLIGKLWLDQKQQKLNM